MSHVLYGRAEGVSDRHRWDNTNMLAWQFGDEPRRCKACGIYQRIVHREFGAGVVEEYSRSADGPWQRERMACDPPVERGLATEREARLAAELRATTLRRALTTAALYLTRRQDQLPYGECAAGVFEGEAVVFCGARRESEHRGGCPFTALSAEIPDLAPLRALVREALATTNMPPGAQFPPESPNRRLADALAEVLAVYPFLGAEPEEVASPAPALITPPSELPELSSAAGVVTKRIDRGDGASDVSFYAIGPKRATYGEALADLRRFEEVPRGE